MKKLTEPLLIFLIAFILTSILTWPFITKIDKFYPDNGDYPVSGSLLAYNQQAILSGKIFHEDYFLGNEFYPQPYTLIYFDFRLLLSLFYTIIYLLANQLVFSINLISFLSFVFSFLAAFYTIKYFINNSLAAIIGSTIYTFNPITLVRFPEHFDLMQKYFLPLVFLFAYKFFSLPNFKNSFWFFLFFTLNAFSAISFQIFTLTTLPFFALPFLISQFLKKNWLYFINLLKSSLVLIIFLPIFLYFDGHYLKFSEAEGLHRPIGLNTFFSARLIDYFSASPTNFLYGEVVKSWDSLRNPKDNSGNFNYQEHTLFLNLIPTLLFLVFLWSLFFRRLKSKQLNDKLFLISFLVLLGLSFLLTFGPFLPPFYYLYQIFPFMKGNRTPVRYEFIFYIPFALFASIGSLLIFQLTKKFFWLVFIFLLMLGGIVLENVDSSYPIKFSQESKLIPQIIVLQNQGKLDFLKDKVTIHYPIHTLDFNNGFDSLYLTWGAITSEKMVNGNVASYISPDQYKFIQEVEQLNEETMKKLSAVGVDYIIIHKKLAGDFWQKKKLINWDLGLIYSDEDITILDLKKYDFNIHLCDFAKDMELSYKQALLPKTYQAVKILKIKNKSDCFLSTIYLNRYQQTTFLSRNLLNQNISQTISFKLPPLIEPYQEIELTDINNELKVN